MTLVVQSHVFVQAMVCLNENYTLVTIFFN